MSSAAEHVSIAKSGDPPEKKNTDYRARRRSILRDFFTNTSAHALPGIVRSQSTHNRVFWSISFIIFTGIMIYFLTKAILDYFEYPTKMDISLAEEWPQYFPAISLCNAQPLRLDRFIDPFLNYTQALNLNISNDTKTWSSGFVSIRNFIINNVNHNESMTTFFYTLPSILYSCSYNSVPCSSSDFISFTSSQYGLCHTFNAKLKNNSNNGVLYLHKDGGDGVLDLGLYLHSHQQVPYVRDGIGVVVLVHDNAQLPLIEAAGILLAPGKKYKLAYKKRITSFLPAPYTTCTEKVSRTMEAMLENYNGADYEYSAPVCLQLCQQAFLYDQCGCINPQLWNARSVVNRTTNEMTLAPLCTRENTCFGNALSKLMASSSLLKEYCSDCSSKCSVTDYIIQVSSLTAPAEWHKNNIRMFAENTSVPLPLNWSTTWSAHVDASYVAISVVRETIIVENNIQTATIGIVDVLSNIGGQTGLWLGISFLSIMELIEMLYRLVRFEFHRVRLAIQKN